MQRTRVPSLVWEDPTVHGATKPMCHNFRACTWQLLKPSSPRARSPQWGKRLCAATQTQGSQEARGDEDWDLHGEKAHICKPRRGAPEETTPADTLTSDSQLPGRWGNPLLCFKTHSSRLLSVGLCQGSRSLPFLSFNTRPCPPHRCLVAQACLTLGDPVDCSTPGFPVLHRLPVFARIHVHWVSDAIQPSHPLPPPSPLGRRRHQAAKVLVLQHQSFQWTPRTDLL